MKIVRKFELTVSVDTEKANTNATRWGETYDWNAYPNWEFNHAGEEVQFIQTCLEEFQRNFSYTGLSSVVKEIKSERS